MCRFLAYLGPPVTLEALLVEPPHSLLRQSWAPRLQSHGTVNADGFGVGWYDQERRPQPARYRTTRPMWADRSFASLAGLVAAPAVLAAVRSATPPLAVEESGTPPFTAGPWLFAHNGAVEGFCGPTGARLRRMVSDRRTSAIEGGSDSEVLFALALDRLDEGASMGAALASVVATVLGVSSARLNLVLTDGRSIAATACGDTLFWRHPGAGGGGPAGGPAGGLVVASEPSDDGPGWQPVPPGSLVEAAPGRVAVTALAASAPS